MKPHLQTIAASAPSLIDATIGKRGYPAEKRPLGVGRRKVGAISFVTLLVCFTISNEADGACSRQPGGAARFTLKGNEASDSRTGLIWQRCSLGKTFNPRQDCSGEPRLMSLQEARKAAENAGSGWRLPTVGELTNLIDRQCGRPPVDVKAFPDLRDGGGVRDNSDDDRIYWTSSEAGIAGLIYYVDFTTGDVDAHSRGFSLAVRLVRSRP